MSKNSDRRARIVSIRAYRLAQKGYTNRQIAEELGLRIEQVPGKIKRGRQALIFDERINV